METAYEERVKRRIQSQMNTEENNPCFKEHHMSLKCLNDNNYDPELCGAYFENYNNCKKFWGEVRKQRRRRGITPALPPLNEREDIKKKFLETGEVEL